MDITVKSAPLSVYRAHRTYVISDFIYLHMAFSSILVSNLFSNMPEKLGEADYHIYVHLICCTKLASENLWRFFYCSIERAKCEEVFNLWLQWAKICTECYLISLWWLHVQFLWTQVFWYLSHSMISKITKKDTFNEDLAYISMQQQVVLESISKQ